MKTLLSLDAFPILVIINGIFMSWLMYHDVPTRNQNFKRIWDGPAPLSNGKDSPNRPLPNQHHPSLEVYIPENTSKRAAVIVLPGGGYKSLAPHETSPPCEWLQENGFVAFALRYRLGPDYSFPVQLIDVQRAIRYVRYHAQTWNIDPDKIGIMGFSAGGHLASMASTFFSLRDDLQSDSIDRESSRPSFQILLYPVIDFSISYRVVSAVLGHEPFPSKQTLMNLSSYLSVKFDTPPAFIVHSTMDKLVPIENSMRYVDALRQANVSVEFHSKDFGLHGFGMDDAWNIPALKWLNKNFV